MPQNTSTWVKTGIATAGAATAGPVGGILARLAGSMLEASLPGLGVFLSKVAASAPEGALDGLPDRILHRLSMPEKLHVNHDLQAGFMDACCEALYDIGGKECFPEIWAGRPQGAPERVSFPATLEGAMLWRGSADPSGAPLADKAVAFLKGMEGAIRGQLLIPLDPPAEEPPASTVTYIQARSPHAVNQAFLEQMILPYSGFNPLLDAELPSLERHLRRHLLDQALVHMGEILRMRTPAWRIFLRAVLEGLHAQVRELSGGQPAVIQRLETLAPTGCSEQLADTLADLLAVYGQIKKDPARDLDEVGREVAEFHRKEQRRIAEAARREAASQAEAAQPVRAPRALRFLADGKWSIEGPQLEVASQWPEEGSPPYPGLRYFDEADAERFFGRERIAARLASLLEERPMLVITGASGSGKSSLVRAGLIPALRSGRVRAGGQQEEEELFPPIGSEGWPVLLLTPTAHPFDALAASLTRSSESIREAVMLLEDLKSDPHSLEFFASRIIGPGDARRKVLLVVDQFEELFTLCRDPAERQAFIQTLLAANPKGAASPLRVVIALRADYYAVCAQYPGLREALSKWQEFIGPMDLDDLRRAIEEPARLGGWELEPGVAEQIMRDYVERDFSMEGSLQPEPGALPLLSHALLEAWQHRRGRLITLESYAETGGVRSAIAFSAEEVYQGHLSAEQKVSARRILLRLAELGEGSREILRRAHIEELNASGGEAQDTEMTLRVLENAGLVTTHEDQVEIAHEALIREWPSLRRWLEEDLESIHIRRRLSEAAEAWQHAQLDTELLYRGARLVEAREWAEAHGDELNALEERFIETSQAMQQSELRQARRRADEQTKVAHRMRWRSVALAVGLAAAALAAVYAVVAWQRERGNTTQLLGQLQQAEVARVVAEQKLAAAEQALTQAANTPPEAGSTPAAGSPAENPQPVSREEEIQRALEASTAERLAQRAQDVRAADPGLALGLDLQAIRLADAPEANPGLYNTFSLYPNVLRYFSYETVKTSDAVRAAAIDPENRTLAAASNFYEAPQWIKIWDIATGRLLQDIPLQEKATHLYFASPGTLKFVAGSKVHTLDVQSKKISGGDQVVPQDLRWMTFSPDLSMFVTLNDAFEVEVWDSATAQVQQRMVLTTLLSFSAPITPLGEISAGNQYLLLQEAIQADPAQVRLHVIDLQKGIEAALLPAKDWDFREFSAAFDPTNQFVVIGSQGEGGDTVEAYRLQAPVVRTMRSEACGGSDTLAFYDPKLLICSGRGSEGGSSLRFVDIQSGVVNYTINPGAQRWAGSLALSEDRTLGAYALDGSIALLDLTAESAAWAAAYHQGPVTGLGYAPDGKTLYSVSPDMQVSQANLTPRAQESFYIPTGEGYTPNPVKRSPNAISPDGAFFVEFTPDQKMRTWSPGTGKRLSETETRLDPDDSVYDFSINNAKKLIATVTRKNRIWIWDYEIQRVALNVISQIGNPRGSWLNAVAISPSGEQVAVAVYDSLSVLEVATGKVLFNSLPVHSSDITRITYSPDGSRIATASSDGSVVLWDALTGQQVGSILPRQDLTSLAFSPDGRRLATGTLDSAAGGQVILWDTQTGLQTGAPLTGHEGSVEQLAFRADGRYLASADSTGMVLVHDLGGAALRARACYVANRELSEEEWKPFAQGVERKDACLPGAQADIESGWWLFSTGQYALAKAQFESALAREGGLQEAVTGRALSEYWLKDYPAAIADFEKVRQANPELMDSSAWSALGWAYYHERQYDLAVEAFSQQIALSPALGRGHDDRSEVYLYQSKYLEMTADIEAAIRSNPEEYGHLFNYNRLVEAYLRMGELGKAGGAVQRMLKSDNDSAVAYYLAGKAYADTHRPAQAISYFGRSVGKDPNLVEAWKGMGWAYQATGNTRRALATFDRVLQLNPASGDAYYGRGFVYARAGQYYQAIAEYFKAQQVDASYASRPELHRAMAEAYFHINNSEAEAEAIRQAVALYEKPAEGYARLGWEYYNAGALDRALELFQQAVTLDPAHIDGYTGQGWVYYSKEDYPAAIRSFEQGLAKDPNALDLVDGLGRVYYQQEQYAKAIEHIEKAMKLDQDYRYFANLNNLGWSYFHLDNLDTAFSYFQQAAMFEPQNPDPPRGMGDIYYQRKAMDKALDSYIKYLKLMGEEKMPMGYVVNRVEELRNRFTETSE